jgi:hypothetical protein
METETARDDRKKPQKERTFVKRQGYWWTRDGSHPRSNHGYLKRSVIVLEEKLGRPLQDGEMVHHIDGDRGNDNPANLEITTRSLHMSQHSPINDRWEQAKDWRQKRMKKAIRMWKQGFNTSQIAEQLDTNHSRVISYLADIRQNTNGKRRKRKIL